LELEDAIDELKGFWFLGFEFLREKDFSQSIAQK